MNPHILRKSILFCLSILLLMVQTGCWSMAEIEDLSMYVGMALDEPEETELEQKLNELGYDQPKKNLISYTVQIVNKQGEEKSSSSGSSSTSKPYLNITETGDSLLQMEREFSTRLERPLIGNHLKVIVINEKLARKQNMNYLLDFFLRDNDIRLSTVVLMSSERARDTLEAKDNATIPTFRLASMINNRRRSLQILPPVTLTNLVGDMRSHTSYMLQNVVATEGIVKFSGAAVINGKTQTCKGLLNEEEALGISWLKGFGVGGVVKITDEMTKQLVTFEVTQMKSKINAKVQNNEISFDVKIQFDARTMENWSKSNKDFDDGFIERMQTAAEEEVERVVKIGLGKIQKKYKTDIVGFGKELQIQHPKQWQHVKDDWDKTFSEIPITYSVKMKLTDNGAKSTH